MNYEPAEPLTSNGDAPEIWNEISRLEGTELEAERLLFEQIEQGYKREPQSR